MAVEYQYMQTKWNPSNKIDRYTERIKDVLNAKNIKNGMGTKPLLTGDRRVLEEF